MQKLGLNIYNYDHLSNNIDAVMIGTPPNLSSSATLSAIKAGKHTFIEPPLDDSSSTRNLFKLV